MEQTLQIPTDYDYSMMNCYQICKRKYYFRHVRGLVGETRQLALEFGKAIHTALDTYYLTKDMSKTLDAFRQSWGECGGDMLEDQKRTQANAERILKGYATKYAQEPFTLLKSEACFEIPVAKRIYMGRRDKVVEWDGAIRPIEHKTSSQLGYSTFNAFNPNLQILGYIYATKQEYPECYSAVVDILKVAKSGPDYARKIETRSEEQIEEFPGLFMDITDEIVNSYAQDLWTPRYSACTYYGECPYRKLCMQTPDLWERMIATEYKVEFWDPRKVD